MIDLGNRPVPPGFFDCHCISTQGGKSLLSLRLSDAGSREEFISLIAAKAREVPKRDWITTEGTWDLLRFPDAEPPRREWIDAVTSDHPVCVSCLDGHMIFCNSLALRMAGVDRTTATPAGGEIVRGEPWARPNRPASW